MKICGSCGLLIGDEQVHRNWHGQLATVAPHLMSTGIGYIQECPLDGNIQRGWFSYGEGWACGHALPKVLWI